MRSILRSYLIAGLISIGLSSFGFCQSYTPPELSASLLTQIDFAKSSAVDEAYSQQFRTCDEVGPRQDTFEGHSVRIPNIPDLKQYYLCSQDKSNLRSLLKVTGGGVLWQSKMALDTDGAWAAWNNYPGATQNKETSIQWPGNLSGQSAQIDPDQYPYIVIPGSVPTPLADAYANPKEVERLKLQFKITTGVHLWNLGVIIFRDRWTPAFVAETGPFSKIGEASVRVFEELGQSRCKKWNANQTHCIGENKKHSPYIEAGLNDPITGKETDQAVFIVWPASAQFGDLTPKNAICKACEMATLKLGLKGAAICLRNKCNSE